MEGLCLQWFVPTASANDVDTTIDLRSYQIKMEEYNYILEYRNIYNVNVVPLFFKTG